MLNLVSLSLEHAKLSTDSLDTHEFVFTSNDITNYIPVNFMDAYNRKVLATAPNNYTTITIINLRLNNIRNNGVTIWVKAIITIINKLPYKKIGAKGFHVGKISHCQHHHYQC